VAQVIYSLTALDDLDRVERFLGGDRVEASRALLRIIDAVELLQESPEVGRPAGSGLRELVISRGRTGYLVLYRFDPVAEVVRVLRLRHQREAGYPE
jgi:plasmid stabilization system protein ParE